VLVADPAEDLGDGIYIEQSLPVVLARNNLFTTANLFRKCLPETISLLPWFYGPEGRSGRPYLSRSRSPYRLTADVGELVFGIGKKYLDRSVLDLCT
jgi:hypothetical protein